MVYYLPRGVTGTLVSLTITNYHEQVHFATDSTLVWSPGQPLPVRVVFTDKASVNFTMAMTNVAKGQTVSSVSGTAVSGMTATLVLW